MLETIKAIEIRGRLFSKKTKLNIFKEPENRISIIFGRNGTGKSTISKGISKFFKMELTENVEDISDLEVSFLNFQDQELELSSNSKKNIFVFNEEFIENNIKLQKSGLETIVTFGEQVDLDTKIKEIEEKIKKDSITLEGEKIELAKYIDEEDITSPYYYKKKMKEILRKDNGWANIDSEIKGNKRNSDVNDFTIEEISRLKPEGTIEKTRETFDEKLEYYIQIKEKDKEIIDNFNYLKIEDGFEEIIIFLLKENFQKFSLSPREQKIYNLVTSGSQQRIEEIKNKFSDSNIKECPYCFQMIETEYREKLLEEISRVLNEEVEKHREKLEISKIKFLKFPTEELSSILVFDKELEEIEELTNDYNDIIKKYNEALDKKINNLYTIVEIENYGLKEKALKVNESLKKLKEKIKKYNEDVKNTNAIKNVLISLNKQIAYFEIKYFYENFEKQLKAKKNIEENIEKIEITIKEKEKEKIHLLQKKKDVKIALDTINLKLKYIFFNENRFALKESEENYKLTSYGKPVSPDNISCGERNIIALCYFFAKINSNKEVLKLYKDKTLIVIDDPISSFDLENKIGIFSFIKSEILKICITNKESKIILLSHDLESIFNFKKSFQEIADNKSEFHSVKKKFICLRELKENCIEDLNERRNEYKSLLGLIFSYANSDSNCPLELDWTIGNIMRRVLEAFSTFAFRTGIEGISCNEMILDSLPDSKYRVYFENLMYRLVLNGESHFEGTVKSAANVGFFSAISREEKIRTARDILCFIQLLNPKHISSYFENTEPEIIKKWTENILK